MLGGGGGVFLGTSRDDGSNVLAMDIGVVLRGGGGSGLGDLTSKWCRGRAKPETRNLDPRP